jgi:hypothetical protein
MVNWKRMGLMISEGISQMEGQLSQKPEVAIQKQLHTTLTNSYGCIQKSKSPAENVKTRVLIAG